MKRMRGAEKRRSGWDRSHPVRRSPGSLDGDARRATVQRVRCRPAGDRLAGWTYKDAGEEIPCGDPSVIDEERAAAGRETLAQRWQEMLEPNRRRAAGQYRAGVLPDGQDVTRVWCPRDPAALRARLGARADGFRSVSASAGRSGHPRRA
jgi:hypothetical protein